MITAALLAAPFLLLIGVLVPRRVLAVALGFLVPVDVFGDVPAIVLDVLRYGLAILLIARSLLQSTKPAPIGNLAWLTVLALVANSAFSAVKYVADLGLASASVPIIGLFSVVVAVLVASARDLHRPLLIGLVAGSTASAVDILLQFLGLPFVGVPTDWGTRYSGLSFSSTNTAPFLALSFALVVAPMLWRTHGSSGLKRLVLILARIGIGVVIATALVYSGGRGGALGLVVALTILVFNLAKHRLELFLLIALSVPLVVYSFWDEVVDYIDRGGRATDLTSGREERNSAALETLQENLTTGIHAGDLGFYSPHTPILLFGLQAGMVGLIGAILATLLLLLVALRGINGNDHDLVLAMLAAIMFVTALLEPVGFYVGLGKAIVLLVVMVSATREEPAEDFPAKEGHFVRPR